MTTAFSTGPGFFAVETHDFNPAVPVGGMMVYCVRFEAYDFSSEIDSDIVFNGALELAEKDKRIAGAILKLGAVIEHNRAALEAFSK